MPRALALYVRSASPASTRRTPRAWRTSWRTTPRTKPRARAARASTPRWRSSRCRLGPDDTAREKRWLDAGDLAACARLLLDAPPRAGLPAPRRRGGPRWPPSGGGPRRRRRRDAVVVTLSRARRARAPRRRRHRDRDVYLQRPQARRCVHRAHRAQRVPDAFE